METEKLNQRMVRSSRNIFIWTLGWVVSLAVVAFAPKFIWDFAPNYTIIAAVINLIFGYKMIIANKLNLEAMDELQRRIHFNAMAITLGISVVVIALYSLMEDVKLIAFEPDPNHVLFVMSFSYITSVPIGAKKYFS